jgi:hypothetical protein
MRIAFMTRSYSRLVAKHGFAFAALCLLLAACGGPEGRGPALSRTAFTASANAACAAAQTRAELLRSLRALRPPAALADLYAQWLKAEQDAVDAADALAHHSKWAEGDPHVALVIADGKATGYARRIGAKTCAARAAGRMPA